MCSCEHGDEMSGSSKSGEFLAQPNDFKIRKKWAARSLWSFTVQLTNEYKQQSAVHRTQNS
jgi:hypothetical protein